ncbi:hypothetical protein N7454_002561 [Penicillium verhagenii]|nr:hypothetical protein N7454_002561 [Penicillium verhagenii]
MCKINFKWLWSFIITSIPWHRQPHPDPDMSRRASVVDLTAQETSEHHELSQLNAGDDGLIHASRREPNTEDDGLIHAPRGETNSMSTESIQDTHDPNYVGYPLARADHITQHISGRESQRNLQRGVQPPLLELPPSLPHGAKRQRSEDHTDSSIPSPSSAQVPVDLTNPNIPPLSTEDASASQQSQGADKPKGLLAAYRCPICMETPRDATSTVCGN